MFERTPYDPEADFKKEARRKVSEAELSGKLPEEVVTTYTDLFVKARRAEAAYKGYEGQDYTTEQGLKDDARMSGGWADAYLAMRGDLNLVDPSKQTLEFVRRCAEQREEHL